MGGGWWLLTMELGLRELGLRIQIWKSFTWRWYWKAQFGRNCQERKYVLEEGQGMFLRE